MLLNPIESLPENRHTIATRPNDNCTFGLLTTDIDIARAELEIQKSQLTFSKSVGVPSGV